MEVVRDFEAVLADYGRDLLWHGRNSRLSACGARSASSVNACDGMRWPEPRDFHRLSMIFLT